MEKGYVYVIMDNFNRVKIGKSLKPEQRFDSISTAAGISIERKYITKPLYRYSELEAYIHKQFDEYRGIGEWFSCCYDDVVDFIDLLDIDKFDKPSHYFDKFFKHLRIKELQIAIRSKLFTNSESAFLFDVLTKCNLKKRFICDKNNKQLNQKEISELFNKDVTNIANVTRTLIEKEILEKVKINNQVFYKLTNKYFKNI